MVNLTDDERQRFALWLQQSAESDEMLVGQLDKLGSAMGPMIKMMKSRAMAARIMARYLKETDTQTISGGNPGAGHSG